MSKSKIPQILTEAKCEVLFLLKAGKIGILFWAAIKNQVKQWPAGATSIRAVGSAGFHLTIVQEAVF